MKGWSAMRFSLSIIDLIFLDTGLRRYDEFFLTAAERLETVPYIPSERSELFPTIFPGNGHDRSLQPPYIKLSSAMSIALRSPNFIDLR